MNRVDRIAAGIIYFRFGYGVALVPTEEGLQRAWDHYTSQRKHARILAKMLLAPMLKRHARQVKELQERIIVLDSRSVDEDD